MIRTPFLVCIHRYSFTIMMFFTQAIAGLALSLMVLVSQDAALPRSASTESSFTASIFSNNNLSTNSAITVKSSSNESTSSSKVDVVANPVTTPANSKTEATLVEAYSKSTSLLVSTSTTSVDSSTLFNSLNLTASSSKFAVVESTVTNPANFTTEATTHIEPSSRSTTMVVSTSPDFKKRVRLNDSEFASTTAITKYAQYSHVGLTTSGSLNMRTTKSSSSDFGEGVTYDTSPATTGQLEDFTMEMSRSKFTTENRQSTSVSAVAGHHQSSSPASNTVSLVSTAQPDSTVGSFGPSSVMSIVSSLIPENDGFNIHLVSLTSEAVTVSSGKC